MALTKSTPLPFPEISMKSPVFPTASKDLVVEFAERFSALQGKFIFCSNYDELESRFKILCQQNGWARVYCNEEPWKVLVDLDLAEDDIAHCQAAVTGCEFLVARTGSMVLSSLRQGRVPSIYAPVHVCIARTAQVVEDVADALTGIQLRYPATLPSQISFATGPSRTADIEKTLVVGVHGPGEVYCFLVDE